MPPSIFGLQGSGFYVGPTQVASHPEPNLPPEDPSRNTTLNGTSNFLMATATAALVIAGCGGREQVPVAQDRHDRGCAQALAESEHRAHKTELISFGVGAVIGVLGLSLILFGARIIKKIRKLF